MRSRLVLATVLFHFATLEVKGNSYGIEGYSEWATDSTLDWFIELKESLAEEIDNIGSNIQWSQWNDHGDQAHDQYSFNWVSWDWSDFNSIWTDIEWSNDWHDDSNWSGDFNEASQQPLRYSRQPPPPSTDSPPIFIDIEKYWTGDPNTDWCRDTWHPQKISTEWQEKIDEFYRSGNITNWGTFPEQVMVVSDLRNINLNDPEALPSMFKSETNYYCTEALCKSHLKARKRLDPGKLVEQTWRFMDIYRRIDCMDCFCRSQSKKDLDEVLSITKDYLKKNEFLKYIVTPDTPEEVAMYFRGLEASLGLENVVHQTYSMYTPLLSMDQATEGPGKDALQINKYAELAHGIYNFCNE